MAGSPGLLSVFRCRGDRRRNKDAASDGALHKRPEAGLGRCMHPVTNTVRCAHALRKTVNAIKRSLGGPQLAPRACGGLAGHRRPEDCKRDCSLGGPRPAPRARGGLAVHRPPEDSKRKHLGLKLVCSACGGRSLQFHYLLVHLCG